MERTIKGPREPYNKYRPSTKLNSLSDLQLLGTIGYHSDIKKSQVCFFFFLCLLYLILYFVHFLKTLVIHVFFLNYKSSSDVGTNKNVKLFTLQGFNIFGRFMSFWLFGKSSLSVFWVKLLVACLWTLCCLTYCFVS